MQETWVWSLGWKIPWRRTWQPTPAFLPGESPQTEESVGCSPRGHKELDTTERLSTAQYSHTVSGRVGLHKLSGGKFGFMALKDEHIFEGQPHSQASPTSTHGQMPWPGSWRQCSVQSRRGHIHILIPSTHQQLPTGGSMKKGKCRVSSASGRSTRSPLLMSAQEAWWPVGRGHYACCLGSWCEYGFNIKPKYWPCWLWEVDWTS